MPSGTWKRWVSHPQQLPVRKVLFQLHKWLGLVLGIYILAMGISGVALLFYPKLYATLRAQPRIPGQGRSLNEQELSNAVRQVYPKAQVSWIWRGASEYSAVEIWLSERGSERKRFFDPVSGKDLGAVMSPAVVVLNLLAGLHRDLLFPAHGKALQFAGGICVALLALSGAIVWWPGASRWVRHIRVRQAAKPSRKIWETHSAVGFWSAWALLLMGFTGAMLAIQDREIISTHWMDRLYWLHSGQFLGTTYKEILLTLLVLTFAVLVITGAEMSWKRIRSSAHRLRTRASIISPAHRPPSGRKPVLLFPWHR
jgi:uncharacterized iron-regulated membrane protein